MERSAKGASMKGAPAVVAIIVAHDPGAWFEETLTSFAEQDYPNMAVLVVDAGSAEPLKERVAAQLPDAFVRRLESNPGFGKAVNDAVGVVDGAAFHLVCHDDVALAPDAVRVLVEEAYRSNAGVVGPKLVTWADGSRLLNVGESIDKSGARAPLTERYELDQEQHDAVRDVFVIPGAVMLIRVDLFETIGGFDEGIDYHNDDLAICWRAHLAGARVVVTPDAVARHLEGMGVRQELELRRPLQNRHRMRTVLICYSTPHRLRVLPQLALITIVEVLYALLVGRTRQARDLVGAWTTNHRARREIRAEREKVAEFRRVPDSEIRSMQVRGSARFSALLRGQLGGTDEDRLRRATTAGRDLAAQLQKGSSKLAIGVWFAIAFVVAVGSRHLLTRGVTSVGEFVPFDSSAVDTLRHWASGWREVGLGSESPSPTLLGVAGFGGIVAFGSMELVRQVLILALLPVGYIGAYRLLAPSGSRRAQTAALIAAVALPVPYVSIAEGRWGALALWAASPWILAQLGQASGLAPFAQPSDAPRRLRRPTLALGVITALVTLVLPTAPILLIVMAVLVVVGSFASLTLRGTMRVLAASLGGAAAAFVLQLPWSADYVLPGARWTSLVGVEAATRSIDPVDVLLLRTGGFGAGILGAGVLVAGGLSLLIGRSWRFEWACRGWALALGGMGLALLADREVVPFALPPSEVALAPAAAGLALAVGLGVLAFELDLRAYRFGIRQVAAAVAGVALVVATVPVLVASLDGRWNQPSGGYGDVLSFLDKESDESAFRILWIGRPDALPLGAYSLDEHLGYATTDHGLPGLGDQFVSASPGAATRLANAIELTRSGETTRVGRVLGPLAIRYVVVLEQLAPAPFDDFSRPVPPDLIESLAAQLDLEAIDLNPALTIFRNSEALPLRSLVPDGYGEDVDLTSVATTESPDAKPVLSDVDGRTSFSGEVPAGRILWPVAASDNWNLSVEGADVSASKAFGFTNAYDVSDAGPGKLTYSTPFARYGILVVQIGLWLFVLLTLLRMRLGPSPEASS